MCVVVVVVVMMMVMVGGDGDDDGVGRPAGRASAPADERAVLGGQAGGRASKLATERAALFLLLVILVIDLLVVTKLQILSTHDGCLASAVDINLPLSPTPPPSVVKLAQILLNSKNLN